MLRRPLFVLVFMLLTLFFTWQVVNWSRNWTLQTLHQQGSDELLEVITQLRAALDEYRYLPFLISQNKSVRLMAMQPQSDNNSDISLFLEQTNLVAGSSSLFVLNAGGSALAYSHWRDEDDFFRRSHQSQEYYKQARDGQRGRQFSLNETSKNPAYFLSSPIYSGTEFIGASVVRIDLNRLESEIFSPSPVLMQDTQDVLFFSSDAFTAYESLTDKVEITGYEMPDGVILQLWKKGTQQWLARSVVLDDLQWKVTVLVDTGPVENNVRNASLFSFGGSIALGLMLLLLRERQLKLRSQNETRETLARSEAKQKAMINNAQVGLFLVDSQGRIIFANEMAQQQFGLSMSLLLDLPLTSLFASQGSELIRRLLKKLGKTDFAPLIAHEVAGRRGDDTEFPMLFSIRNMENNTERFKTGQYLVTVIDISRRKRLELALKDANESLEHKVSERTAELHAAQDELVQAGKMAALGRMSTAVVHELNQPLTAIRNYIAICRQVLQQPELVGENLLIVDELTQRMALITSQLKTFAYKKPAKLQPISVQMAIEHSLQMFRQRTEDEDFYVDLSLSDEELYILGDSARLEQVLVNLIRNALDAMALSEQKVLSIRAGISASSQVTIEFKDTGSGISEEMLDNLFEPFMTSKSMGDGLGLGLSIVKSIVRDLGGNISAENHSNGGACFTVTLPLCTQNTESYL